MSVGVAALVVLVVIMTMFPICVVVVATMSSIADARRIRNRKTRIAAETKDWDGGKALTIPEEPPKVYESYDHPAPPIALLGASLPQAPVGYGWEIVAVINEDDNPALRLAMLDLKTSTVVDAIERDMTIVRKWQWAEDDTYAAFYRRAQAIEQEECDRESHEAMERYSRAGYRWVDQPAPKYQTPDGKLAGKVMMANLITPMVDWAALLTLRYIVEHPDETKCNYMLIESMEGVK